MFKKLDNSLSPKNLALLAVITLIYFLAAKLGLSTAFVHPRGAPIWMSAGISVAAFILFGYRVWPAIFIGGLLDHFTAQGFVINTLLIPAACTLEGITAAYLVNKFAEGAKAFDTGKGVLRFALFACICAPAINPVVGLGIDYFTGNTNLVGSGFRLLTWWLAYGVGTLMAAPFLILLLRASHRRLDLRGSGS